MNKSHHKTGIIYTSLPDGNDLLTPIKKQIQTCRKIAKMAGIEILQEFSDVGNNPKHINSSPELQHAISMVSNSKVDYLITFSMESISMNFADFLNLQIKLKKEGVEIFCAQPEFICNRFTEMFKTGVANYLHHNGQISFTGDFEPLRVAEMMLLDAL